jgi:PilZ domain
MPPLNLSCTPGGAVMPIHTSLALQGSDSRDWSIRPRTNCEELGGCRQSIRFPIKLLARYQAGGKSGWGEIVNISSRGALLETDRALIMDAPVAVYIKWPILLHNSVQLSLIVSGTIIRIEPGRVALTIEKYEFRTCVRAFFQHTRLVAVSGPCAARATGSRRIPDRPIASTASTDASSRRLARRPAAKLVRERPLLIALPSGRPGIAPEISGNSHRRKSELDNARWERVFQEKFADPGYYSSRLLSHSSPTADF